MILDATCGGKYMYHGNNKAFNQDEIICMDIRKGTFTYTYWDVKPIQVEPDILADCKHLPFRPLCFSLIIFDPPHLDASLDSHMGPKYGGITLKEYRIMLALSNIEFERVLKYGGILLVKILSWEDREYYTKRILTNFKLLLDIDYRSEGKKLTSKNTTHWMIFIKPSALKTQSTCAYYLPKLPTKPTSHPKRHRLPLQPSKPQSHL